MGKTFRENYCDLDSDDYYFKVKKNNKYRKQNRQKIKNYLRRIDIQNIGEEDDEYLDEINEVEN